MHSIALRVYRLVASGLNCVVKLYMAFDYIQVSFAKETGISFGNINLSQSYKYNL